jgi:hypothetical protein
MRALKTCALPHHVSSPTNRSQPLIFGSFYQEKEQRTRMISD